MKTGGDVLDVENDNMASGPGVGWIAEVCFVSYRTAFFSFFCCFHDGGAYGSYFHID